MTDIQDTGPLDWRIPIVDSQGRPTPEFQRRWATQRDNTTGLSTNVSQTTSLSTGVSTVASTVGSISTGFSTVKSQVNSISTGLSVVTSSVISLSTSASTGLSTTNSNVSSLSTVVASLSTGGGSSTGGIPVSIGVSNPPVLVDSGDGQLIIITYTGS